MTTPGDVTLTTSLGKETSVLTLLSEMKERWDVGHVEKKRARLHEAYVYNRMLGGRMELEGTITTLLNAPRVTKNKVRRALLSWAARLVKGRTAQLVRPSDTEMRDTAAADAANAILENLRAEEGKDSLLVWGVILAAMHGTSALYRTYDPDFGHWLTRLPRIDPATGLPVRDAAGAVVYDKKKERGMPHTEVLSLFDFVTSGEHDAHLGKWLLVRRWLDPDVALSLLVDVARSDAEGKALEEGASPEEAKIAGLEAGKRVPPPPADKVQNHMQAGAARDAVPGYEMWWRPGERARFVDGLFSTVIGTTVTNCTTFPYEHGELPIALIRAMDVPDEFYGATWMEDAVPQQIGLNHTLQVTACRAEVAGQLRTLAVKGVASKWGQTADGMIEVDTKEELEHVKEHKVSEIPRDMFEMADRYEDGIDDTAGVSGVASSGDTAAETKNARLVAYATQIDDEQNAHARGNIETADAISDAQALALVKQFWSKERLIRTVGEDNAIDAAFFSSADLANVDFKLYPAPGAETQPAGRAKSAEEGTLAGLRDPASGAEIAQTGLPNTMQGGQDRARVQGLVQAAMSGQPVQADLTINPKVAVDELRKSLVALSAYGPKLTMPIRALIQEYQESGQQAQQEAQQVQPQKRAPPPQQGANVLPTPGATQ